MGCRAGRSGPIGPDRTGRHRSGRRPDRQHRRSPIWCTAIARPIWPATSPRATRIRKSPAMKYGTTSTIPSSPGSPPKAGSSTPAPATGRPSGPGWPGGALLRRSARRSTTPCWGQPGERCNGPSPSSRQRVKASLLEGLDLSKSFKGRRVVDDVSVRVEQGEIVGLLGPNGAGKTTTFYLITGLIRPDEGRVRLDGRGTYRRADVPAGAERHRLSGAGALGLPQDDRRGEHSSHPGDPRSRAGRAVQPAGSHAGRAVDQASAQERGRTP